MWYQNLTSAAKQTPELLKSHESMCNAAPSHFTPIVNDWGIRILESQYQRKETPMLKYVNTPGAT